MVDDDKSQRFTGILAFAIASAVIGGSFQYGYNIAVVNAPAKIIKENFFGDDDSSEAITIRPSAVPYQEGFEFNSTAGGAVENTEESNYETLMWSLTVSIYNVGGMIGSLLTGFLTGKLGRKGALLANNAFSVIGAILMGTSKLADSLEMIIVARFLLGLFGGFATGIVPLYLTEISPKKYRGGIGVVNQLFITIGILTAQVLSLKDILGSEVLWPLLLAFTAVPSVIQLLTLPFLPETPRCLLIDRNQKEKSRKALVKFRGTDEVDKEMREMQLEAEAESTDDQMSIRELFQDKSVRWQLISIIVLHVCQQLCGINAIFFYLNRIFESAGVPEEMQDYASVGVGSVNVIMTVVSVLLMDYAGRKILLGGGYAISAVFCILMTISLSLQSTIPVMSYMSIVSVIGFIIGFAIGPGPVPWIFNTEFFRQSARPSASAIGCTFNWTFNFALALVFPFMQKAMKEYVFLFFLAICIFASSYVFLIIPETKHKTFQEINRMFAKRNKLKVSELVLDEDGNEMTNLTA